MRFVFPTMLAVMFAAAWPPSAHAEPTVPPPAAEAEQPAKEAQDPAVTGEPSSGADVNKADPGEVATAVRPAPAAAPASPAEPKLTGAMDTICLILESAAEANGLPLEFFARVIWQESRFQANAVGPMTRRGYRAQGIAQFMPYTAGERGLLDPFNPVAALPKAAEFLSELRGEFGNLGLAAAAYNAGPRRVRDYLAGRGGMPGETRNYVRAITGRSVDDWAALSREGGKDGVARPTSCRQLAALLKEQPSLFIGELERRVAEGTMRPWGVQLSAGFSRTRVLEAYARLERQYRTQLENRDPMIIHTVLRSRGTSGFYQVRVGVDSRADANKLCGELRAKGGPCMVLRNSRGSPELISSATKPAG